MDQQFRSLERSIPHRSSTYPWSDRALSTSKWSPQHASSSPSKPHSPHFLASSSSGRSAHCPVKSVTGLATFDPPPFLTSWQDTNLSNQPLQLSALRVQKRGLPHPLAALDGPRALTREVAQPSRHLFNGLTSISKERYMEYRNLGRTGVKVSEL